jgi:hypothetical protein
MRRFSWRPAAAVAVGCGLLLGSGLGATTAALWSSAAGQDAGAQVGVGQVYVAAARDGALSVAGGSGGAFQPAAVTFSEDDAVAAASQQAGTVLDFTVQVKGDGNTGVDYALVFPAATDGSVAANTIFTLYPKGGAATCAAADGTGGSWEVRPGQRVGLFPGMRPNSADADPSATADTAWCLAAQLDPQSLKDSSYSAKATATTAGGLKASAEASWSATIVPADGRGDPPYLISIEPDFTRPGQTAPVAGAATVTALSP